GNRLVQLNITSPVNLKVFQETGGLSAMKGDIRIEDEALPGGSFQFPFIGSLQTDLIKDELTSEINAVLNGSKLGFRVKAITLKDPKLDFDLTADKLDFNTLFPSAAPPAAAPPAPEDGKAPDAAAPKPAPAKPAKPAPSVPAETMNLSFLDSVDVSGKITIGDLKV